MQMETEIEKDHLAPQTSESGSKLFAWAKRDRCGKLFEGVAIADDYTPTFGEMMISIIIMRSAVCLPLQFVLLTAH